MTGGTAAYEHWEPHDHQAALRNQITRTRADLGDTITELAARTDVKARAREAVAQARTRAQETMRSKAVFAAMRTADAARSGASSARTALNWVGRSPALVAIGGGVGALAGIGIYALVRRRLPLGMRLPSLRPGLFRRRPNRARRMAARGARRAAVHGARRVAARGARRAMAKGRGR